MNKKIKFIINNWDTINLFPGAPDNEYENEIREIAKFIETNKKLSEESLTNKIHETFRENLFVSTKNDCALISQQIINLITLNKLP